MLTLLTSLAASASLSCWLRVRTSDCNWCSLFLSSLSLVATINWAAWSKESYEAYRKWLKKVILKSVM